MTDLPCAALMAASIALLLREVFLYLRTRKNGNGNGHF